MVVCIANLVYATASVILLTLDNLWIGWKRVTNFSEMTNMPAHTSTYIKVANSKLRHCDNSKMLPEYHETERTWPTGPQVPVITGIS